MLVGPVGLVELAGLFIPVKLIGLVDELVSSAALVELVASSTD